MRAHRLGNHAEAASNVNGDKMDDRGSRSCDIDARFDHDLLARWPTRHSRIFSVFILDNQAAIFPLLNLSRAFWMLAQLVLTFSPATATSYLHTADTSGACPVWLKYEKSLDSQTSPVDPFSKSMEYWLHCFHNQAFEKKSWWSISNVPGINVLLVSCIVRFPAMTVNFCISAGPIWRGLTRDIYMGLTQSIADHSPVISSALRRPHCNLIEPHTFSERRMIVITTTPLCSYTVDTDAIHYPPPP